MSITSLSSTTTTTTTTLPKHSSEATAVPLAAISTAAATTTTSTATTTTSTTTSPTATTLASAITGEQRPSLIHFLRTICVRAAVTELALVISLIYVDRLKKALSNMARGDPDTPFRIILSALLVVKKFIEEDCVGLNRLFSQITDGLYSVHDINTMERSFLGLLKFSLYVTDKDVVEYIRSHQTELQGVDLLKSLSKPAMAA
ncbi:hypothetical protein BGZ98_008950 [Dissophora globulifera]|nr:hypothetical protein BGZ98_008950 [Dissophora globulifera]